MATTSQQRNRRRGPTTRPVPDAPKRGGPGMQQVKYTIAPRQVQYVSAHAQALGISASEMLRRVIDEYILRRQTGEPIERSRG